MSTVTVTILGKPIGKGRPRFSTAGGFARSYTPAKTVEYENLVRMEWEKTGAKKLEGAISATIICHFPIPKSVSKKRRALMDGRFYTSKPDCDNIAKIILDALNGIAYDDDSQVAMLSVTKLYNADETMVKVTLVEGGRDGIQT